MNSLDTHQRHVWLGIPPGDDAASDYRLLGLAECECDVEVIGFVSAWRIEFVESLVNGPDAAAAKALLARLRKARDLLLDPVRKARYDEQLIRANKGRRLPPLGAKDDARRWLGVVSRSPTGPTDHELLGIAADEADKAVIRTQYDQRMSMLRRMERLCTDDEQKRVQALTTQLATAGSRLTRLLAKQNANTQKPYTNVTRIVASTVMPPVVTAVAPNSRLTETDEVLFENQLRQLALVDSKHSQAKSPREASGVRIATAIAGAIPALSVLVGLVIIVFGVRRFVMTGERSSQFNVNMANTAVEPGSESRQTDPDSDIISTVTTRPPDHPDTGRIAVDASKLNPQPAEQQVQTRIPETSPLASTSAPAPASPEEPTAPTNTASNLAVATTRPPAAEPIRDTSDAAEQTTTVATGIGPNQIATLIVDEKGNAYPVSIRDFKAGEDHTVVANNIRGYLRYVVAEKRWSPSLGTTPVPDGSLELRSMPTTGTKYVITTRQKGVRTPIMAQPGTIQLLFAHVDSDGVVRFTPIGWRQPGKGELVETARRHVLAALVSAQNPHKPFAIPASTSRLRR